MQVGKARSNPVGIPSSGHSVLHPGARGFATISVYPGSVSARRDAQSGTQRMEDRREYESMEDSKWNRVEGN